MAGVDDDRGGGVDAGPTRPDKAGGGVAARATRSGNVRDSGTTAALEGHASVSLPVNSACKAGEVDPSRTATIFFFGHTTRNWRGTHFFGTSIRVTQTSSGL